MKISFSVSLKPESGKQKFAIRLADSFKKKGVNVTDKKPDVNLVFVDGVKKGCKNIFRLDGVLMNTRVNYKKKNKKILNIMRSCDGVVYQNKFCKKAGDAFLGTFKSHAVIMNGAECPDVSPYRHHRKYVLTMCRWRPHKRLRETVDGFLDSDLVSDFDLLVLGDNPDYVYKHPNVIYLGKKNGDELWSFIKGCEFAVHLAYIDWCPNSVVECLVAGKNILHSSTGGTKNIVKNNGIAISDRAWKFNAIDLYDPPKLDKLELNRGFSQMLSLPPPCVDYLNIDNISEQYINYCSKILETTN